jgi:hypothetical protein
MKKYYVIAMLMFSVAATVHAQHKARTGFYAGPSFSSFLTKSYGASERSKLKAGFNAGILWDIPVSRSLSIHTGLKFIQKGGMEKDGDYKVSMTINDLEFPVNLVYYTNGFKGSFFFGAGLTMAMTLTGKLTEKDNGDKYSEKIDFGIKEDDDLKSFDFGANILGGFEWKNGIVVALNYNHGFANLSNIPGDVTRTSYFGVKLGYMLRKR